MCSWLLSNSTSRPETILSQFQTIEINIAIYPSKKEATRTKEENLATVLHIYICIGYQIKVERSECSNK
jgi:hypothetical protein